MRKKNSKNYLALLVVASLVSGTLMTSTVYGADYTDPITGDASKDTAYASVIENGNYNFTDGTHIKVRDDNPKAIAHIDDLDVYYMVKANGASDYTVSGKDYVKGTMFLNNSTKQMTGLLAVDDRKITWNVRDTSLNLNTNTNNDGRERGDYTVAVAIGTTADTNLHADTGLFINGNMEINVTGTENVHAIGIVSGSGTIKVMKNLTVNVDGNRGDSIAVLANNGQIFINHDGTQPLSNTICLTGDIGTIKEVENNQVEGNGKLTLALTNRNSYWRGISKYNESTEADGPYTRVISEGTFNLHLANQAIWENTMVGKLDLYPGYKGSRITSLIGGTSSEHAGYIYQKDSQPIRIGKQSGHLVVMYDHDGTNPTQFNAGNIIVASAESGSHLTLRTDNRGIRMTDGHLDKEHAGQVLDSLAHKAIYEAYKDANGQERNLTGKVEIAEGLTTSSLWKAYGDVQFDRTTGAGSLKDKKVVLDSESTPSPDPAPNPTPSPDPAPNPMPSPDPAPSPTPGVFSGDYETKVMKGVRGSLFMDVIAFRQNMNDISKRLGDIRFADTTSGVWALLEGGRTEYNGARLDEKLTFKDVQIGYDKKDKNGLIRGMAFQYIVGDMSGPYHTGQVNNYALGLYASKVKKDGSYFDLIGKVGYLKTDFNVKTNDVAFDGSMGRNGVLLSAEYGKRIVREKGFYVEPQVELTYTGVEAKRENYNTHYKGNTLLTVNQYPFNSLIGRVGIAVGIKGENNSLYAKLSLLHDFVGRWKTGFSAPGEETKIVRESLKDTWLTLQVGGAWNFSNDKYLYGNVLTSFGGHYKEKWKANVGVRYRF